MDLALLVSMNFATSLRLYLPFAIPTYIIVDKSSYQDEKIEAVIFRPHNHRPERTMMNFWWLSFHFFSIEICSLIHGPLVFAGLQLVSLGFRDCRPLG